MQIVFVDLAGSERLRESQSEGTTAAEGRQINKSLFALGKVIAALAERRAVAVASSKRDRFGSVASPPPSPVSGPLGSPTATGPSAVGQSRGRSGTAGDISVDSHVPYRDSKLTKMLQVEARAVCIGFSSPLY